MVMLSAVESAILDADNTFGRVDSCRALVLALNVPQ
jgi:hypothetical protein